MRVMVFGKATKETEAGVMPTAEAWEAMEQFTEKLAQAKIVVAAEGLKPSSTGVRIRYSGDDRTVIDGPFAETKELVAGYMIWEVKSMDEAIAWAKKYPLPEGSEVEIRPIFTYSAEEVDEIRLHEAQAAQVRELLLAEAQRVQRRDLATDLADVGPQVDALGAAAEAVLDLRAREMVQHDLHHGELVQVGVEQGLDDHARGL